MSKLEKDMESVMRKRVIDSIVCTDKKTSIYLNNKKLKGKGLVDYVKNYYNFEEIFYE